MYSILIGNAETADCFLYTLIESDRTPVYRTSGKQRCGVRLVTVVVVIMSYGCFNCLPTVLLSVCSTATPT